MTWTVKVTHDNNGLDVYEKQFILFRKARRHFKQLAEQITIMHGYPMAQGTAYRFLSMTFSVPNNIMRLTIIHNDEQDQSTEAIKGSFDLDFYPLDSRWKEFSKGDE